MGSWGPPAPKPGHLLSRQGRLPETHGPVLGLSVSYRTSLAIRTCETHGKEEDMEWGTLFPRNCRLLVHTGMGPHRGAPGKGQCQTGLGDSLSCVLVLWPSSGKSPAPAPGTADCALQVAVDDWAGLGAIRSPQRWYCGPVGLRRGQAGAGRSSRSPLLPPKALGSIKCRVMWEPSRAGVGAGGSQHTRPLSKSPQEGMVGLGPDQLHQSL